VRGGRSLATVEIEQRSNHNLNCSVEMVLTEYLNSTCRVLWYRCDCRVDHGGHTRTGKAAIKGTHHDACQPGASSSTGNHHRHHSRRSHYDRRQHSSTSTGDPKQVDSDPEGPGVLATGAGTQAGTASIPVIPQARGSLSLGTSELVATGTTLLDFSSLVDSLDAGEVPAPRRGEPVVPPRGGPSHSVQYALQGDRDGGPALVPQPQAQPPEPIGGPHGGPMPGVIAGLGTESACGGSRRRLEALRVAGSTQAGSPRSASLSVVGSSFGTGSSSQPEGSERALLDTVDTAEAFKLLGVADDHATGASACEGYDKR
jgi:hypothetical protein